MKTLLLLSIALGAAACGKSSSSSGKTCDDVEAAMRRIEPERSKDLEKGLFARLCREKPDFTQARIDCVASAQTSDDLKRCKETGGVATAKPAAPAAAPGWKNVPAFGVQVQAPGDAKVEESDSNAHVGNGTFKLNLFRVDAHSLKTAADAKASLEKELGFVKFTKEESGAKTWRFDYDLDGGKAGTNARIDVGHPLDCGVHKVAPDIAAQVAAACASAKAL